MRWRISSRYKALAKHLRLYILKRRVKIESLLQVDRLIQHFVVAVVAFLGHSLSIFFFNLSDLEIGSAQCLVQGIIGLKHMLSLGHFLTVFVIQLVMVALQVADTLPQKLY